MSGDSSLVVELKSRIQDLFRRDVPLDVVIEPRVNPAASSRPAASGGVGFTQYEPKSLGCSLCVGFFRFERRDATINFIGTRVTTRLFSGPTILGTTGAGGFRLTHPPLATMRHSRNHGPCFCNATTTFFVEHLHDLPGEGLKVFGHARAALWPPMRSATTRRAIRASTGPLAQLRHERR